MGEGGSPKSRVRTGDIPPQHVQALVPVVELIVIAALKARAAEPECLHIVADSGPHDRGRHMSNIGNPFGGGDLALESGRVLQCPHAPASLVGIARLRTAKTVKLFMTIDLLCCAVREIFVHRVAGSLEEAPQKLNPI